MIRSVAQALVSAAATLIPATRSSRLLTLIYHRVRPAGDAMFPGEVTAHQFDWQMALLRRYCNPLRLGDAVNMLRDRELPSRAVAITFDDGYRDNATIALPILLKHKVPATFFVATSFLDGGIMWNDAVIEAIRATRLNHFHLAGLDITGTSLATDADRGRLAEHIIRCIKHLPPPERARWVEEVVELSGVVLPRDLMMDAGETKQLHQSGMEVGAHTRSHPILSTLAPELARQEIAGSREDLEALIGAPVTAFAYPNGRPGEDYGQRECQLVEELGFDYAVATRWGVAGAATDRFQLPRFTPWDRQPAGWLARLLLQFRQMV